MLELPYQLILLPNPVLLYPETSRGLDYLNLEILNAVQDVSLLLIDFLLDTLGLLSDERLDLLVSQFLRLSPVSLCLERVLSQLFLVVLFLLVTPVFEVFSQLAH